MFLYMCISGYSTINVYKHSSCFLFNFFLLSTEKNPLIATKEINSSVPSMLLQILCISYFCSPRSHAFLTFAPLDTVHFLLCSPDPMHRLLLPLRILYLFLFRQMESFLYHWAMTFLSEHFPITDCIDLPCFQQLHHLIDIAKKDSLWLCQLRFPGLGM